MGWFPRDLIPSRRGGGGVIKEKNRDTRGREREREDRYIDSTVVFI
jgi:hypothetical protein